MEVTHTGEAITNLLVRKTGMSDVLPYAVFSYTKGNAGLVHTECIQMHVIGGVLRRGLPNKTQCFGGGMSEP